MPDKSSPKMTEEEKDWDSSWAMLAEQVLSPRQPCPDPTWIRSPVVLVPDSKPGRNGKLQWSLKVTVFIQILVLTLTTEAPLMNY